MGKNNLIILAILDHKTLPTLLSIPYSLFPVGGQKPFSFFIIL
ncbi:MULTISPECIES: hypothetical protein [unclassified Moorena]|nr:MULTISPECIES: hypothetical protein [unclassified Moorena]